MCGCFGSRGWKRWCVRCEFNRSRRDSVQRFSPVRRHFNASYIRRILPRVYLRINTPLTSPRPGVHRTGHRTSSRVPQSVRTVRAPKSLARFRRRRPLSSHVSPCRRWRRGPWRGTRAPRMHSSRRRKPRRKREHAEAGTESEFSRDTKQPRATSSSHPLVSNFISIFGSSLQHVGASDH